jgi:hypothetical protein
VASSNLAPEPWPSEVNGTLAGSRSVTQQQGVFAQTLVIRIAPKLAAICAGLVWAFTAGQTFKLHSSIEQNVA